VPTLQRYRLGAGAIAMSSGLLRGLDLRAMVRPVMQGLADLVPGTVGLSVRDQTDMVFLEYARSPQTVGLFSVVGTRVSLPLSAAGRAYVAGLPASSRNLLLADLDVAMPEPAARLRAWLEHGVAQLDQEGFVVSCREWHPHINGLAIPLHHAATQSTFVLGIGVLASVYDAGRLCAEVAPLLLDASVRVGALLNGAPETAFPHQPIPGPSRSAPAP
jgi:DNA-binding IclR family transcriptional regulator